MAPGLHQHGTSECKGAAQRHVAAGLDDDFVVVRRCGGQAAAHHALDHHVLTAQGHERAGFEPAAALGHGQRAQFGADVNASELGVVSTNHAVDQYGILAGQHNPTARIQGLEHAGAAGFETDFGAAGLSLGTGGDDDVALCLQAAGDLQRLLGVDDDVGVTAGGHQLAAQHGVASRAEHHAATQGLKPAGRGEVDVLGTAGARQGMELDGAVRTHITGNGDRTAFQRGVAHQHGRATGAGVDGRGTHGGGLAARHAAVADLAQAQQLGMTALHPGEHKGIGLDATGRRGRDELQLAVKVAHLQAADVVGGQAQRAVQGGLHIGHQVEQVVVVFSVCSGHGDARAAFVGRTAAWVQRDVKLHIAAQAAAGEFGKALADQLQVPG